MQVVWEEGRNPWALVVCESSVGMDTLSLLVSWVPQMESRSTQVSLILSDALLIGRSAEIDLLEQ